MPNFITIRQGEQKLYSKKFAGGGKGKKPNEIMALDDK